jgi:hypothetical protein
VSSESRSPTPGPVPGRSSADLDWPQSPSAFRVIRAANKGTFSLNPKKMFGPRNWDNAKPSMQAGGVPGWMNFDDEWVDEVKRALSACKV